jgi:hypothetical protein
MAVRALRGRSGKLVDRIELECQSLDRLEALDAQSLQLPGETGGTRHNETCAGRSALVGLTYQSGARVDRLGGMCAEIATTAGRDEAVMDLPSHQLPAHGGTGGKVDQDQCAEGSVLVGLHLRMGAQLDGVGGVCASATDWSTGRSVATTILPMRGTARGRLVSRLCPLGAFLVGWRMAAGQHVEMVSPVCRNFR